MTTDSFPTPPAPAEPAARTGAYLRLCGLGPAAAGELTHRPLDEIQDLLDEWAARLVPARPDEGPQQNRARARAQLLLAEGPARWPDQFLHPAPTPELAAAVQAVALQPKLALRPTTMTPQFIDLGPVSEVAHGTWKTFDAWPVLRGLTVWLLFTLLLALVFYVVRF